MVGKTETSYFFFGFFLLVLGLVLGPTYAVYTAFFFSSLFSLGPQGPSLATKSQAPDSVRVTTKVGSRRLDKSQSLEDEDDCCQFDMGRSS